MSFEVGDKVWDVRFGHGVVTSRTGAQDDGDEVSVQFSNKVHNITYAADGRYRHGDFAPTLYHKGTEILPASEPLRHKFTEFDCVLARDFDDEPWHICAFKSLHAGKDKKYIVYGPGGCNIYLRYCIPIKDHEYLIGTNAEA